MGHILVVDDEPIIRKGLTVMLQQYGHKVKSVRAAEHGVQAIQLVEASVPDLVLTDIRMPKMDGLELCRMLHERFPGVQIAVISGHSDFGYAQTCMRFGVKEYILKPFRPHDIHELLDRMFVNIKPGRVLSVAQYEEWIGRLVEAIWSLRQQDTDDCLAEWNAYCKHFVATDQDYVNILNECLETLKKRLAAKRFIVDTSPIRGSSGEAGFQQFQAQVNAMVRELSLQRGGQDLMRMAIAYIDARIAEEVTLEELAEHLGITPQYASLLFKKAHQETFSQYRIHKRIELAKQLLENPSYRTADVGTEVGYDNYPHFSKTFKKITGMSPQEYRSQLGIK